MFCLFLIVCLPLVQAQQNSQTATLTPVIDVELPESYNRAHITISGDTQVGARIELSVNGKPKKILDYSRDGTFTFNYVELDPNANNLITIYGELDGNSNLRSFNVFVDLVEPDINLSKEIPPATDMSSILVEGTVSEPSEVRIILNNNEIFSGQTDSFSQTVNLAEGNNLLEITAEDDSGNKGERSFTIVSDTQPPTLEDVEPLEGGANYYEGRAVTDVVGKTEPGAEVYMFVSPTFFPGGEPEELTLDNILGGAQYRVTADSNGDFRIRNVDFENPGTPIGIEISPQLAEILGKDQEFIGTTVPTYAPTPQQTAPSLEQDAVQGIQTEDKTVQVYLIVVDRVGLHEQDMYSVDIHSCFSGSFTFGIDALEEYQTPSLLSPSRLDEGTEIISFVLGLDYHGNLPNRLNATGNEGYWEVESVRIEKACGSGFVEKDPSYQYACQIMPDNPAIMQEINLEKTNWYFRYNLGSTEQFVEREEENFWKILDNYEMKFPLLVTVAYTEKEAGQNPESKTQLACRHVTYFVDVPVEPKDVLPDWMLTESRERINESIELIDKIIEPLDQAIRYIGMACLGGVVVRFALQFVRRFSETLAIGYCVADEVQSAVGGGSGAQKCFIKTPDQLQKCYYITKSGKRPIPKEAEGELDFVCEEIPASDAQNYVGGDPVINLEDSNNARHFSTVIDAWRAEEDIYIAYRYLCDRTFCHSAPAKWTQDEPIHKIRQQIYAERKCTPDAGTARFFVPVDNCYETQKDELLNEIAVGGRNRIKDDKCYVLGNEIYMIESEETGYTEMRRIDEKAKTRETIKAKKKGNTYYTADTIKCEEACELKEGGPWEDKCLTSESEQVESGLWYNYGPTEDCFPEKECYCQRKDEEAWEDEKESYQTWVAGPENGEGTGSELKGEWPWFYRQWQIYRDSNGKRGVYYPEERYYAGRDAPAAFGMNYLPDYIIFGEGKTSEVNPFTQHIGAIQTACLTGIVQRLRLLKNILTGLDNCFFQIQTTGEADAGVCKELLTQYVCNLIYQVYAMFTNECSPADPGSTGEKDVLDLGDFLGAGAGALEGSMEDMSAELTEDYGNAQTDNFLEGGARSLSKKICLAAFGYDVGFDVDSFIDASYSVPFRTSAAVFTMHGQRGVREYLGFDPTSLNALYEYRAAWTIFPGCDIESYTVDLAAVTEAERREYNLDCSAVGEMGCDNLNGNSEKIRPFASGGSLAQGEYKDDNNAMTITDDYRYDHIKITLNLAPEWDAEKCFPPENRQGDRAVFYFPIYDATVRDVVQCSVSNGKFICSAFELGSLAQAWIEDVECQDPETRDWKNCERIDFSATPANNTFDQLKVRADVFNTGDKQCLKAYVQTTYGGQRPQANVWWPVIGIGQARTVPVEMELISTIDDGIYSGRTGYSMTPGNALNIEVQGAPAVVVSPFDIYFGTKKEGKMNEKITVPQYFQVTQSQDEPSGEDEDWEEYREILSDPTGKFNFKVEEFNVDYKEKTGDIIHNERIYILPKIGGTSQQQTWQLHLKLYRPDANGQCNSGGAVRLTTPAGLGYETERTIPIKVLKERFLTPEKKVYARGKTAYDKRDFSSAAQSFDEVIQMNKNTRENALAYYWYAVSRIQEGAVRNEKLSLYAEEIRTRINLFEDKDENIYSSEIKNLPEYKMVRAYLSEIKGALPEEE